MAHLEVGPSKSLICAGLKLSEEKMLTYSAYASHGHASLLRLGHAKA